MRQKPFNELVLEAIIALHNEELYGPKEGPEGKVKLTFDASLNSYLVSKGIITLVGPLEDEPRFTDSGRAYYNALLTAINQVAR